MYGKFYFLADENRVLHFNGLYYVEDDVGEIAGNAAIGQKPRTNFHAIVMRLRSREDARVPEGYGIEGG